MPAHFPHVWLVWFCLVALLVSTASANEVRRKQTDQSAATLKKRLLVVYNKNAPASEFLANYYAEKRGIAPERVLGVETALEEEIDRKTFEETIRDPIDAYMREKGWIQRSLAHATMGGRSRTLLEARHNEVWAMVLIRGMPLKVRHDPAIVDSLSPTAALNTNGASVDSELATLPILGQPLNGFLHNDYFYSGFARPYDALDSRRFIMVTRLDGPTPEDVKRMIDDAIYAEKHRLTGRGLFDIRGLKDEKNPYIRGDIWIRTAYELFAREGWNVILDESPQLFSQELPLANIGFYAGWYDAKATGPFIRAPKRFSRGAVAYHIHSFSASSVRDVSRGWVAPLIASGATATMGCVYEPYLDFTPHVDIFADRLMNHFTFAEAAYMSQKRLSWMVVMLGDPLYRPFARPLDEAAQEATALSREWFQLEQVRRDLRRNKARFSLPEATEKLLQEGKSEVAWEGYADLVMEKDDPLLMGEIEPAYQMALSLALRPLDKIRIGKKLADHLRTEGREDEADATLSMLRKRWPDEAMEFGLIPRELAPVSEEGAEAQDEESATDQPAPLPLPPDAQDKGNGSKEPRGR